VPHCVIQEKEEEEETLNYKKLNQLNSASLITAIFPFGAFI
jgi:hypothetical protein